MEIDLFHHFSQNASVERFGTPNKKGLYEPIEQTSDEKTHLQELFLKHRSSPTWILTEMF